MSPDVLDHPTVDQLSNQEIEAEFENIVEAMNENEAGPDFSALADHLEHNHDHDHECHAGCEHDHGEADSVANALFDSAEHSGHNHEHAHGHVCDAHCEHNQHEADKTADHMFNAKQAEQNHNHEHAHDHHECGSNCEHNHEAADNVANGLYAKHEADHGHEHNHEEAHICNAHCEHNHRQANEAADAAFAKAHEEHAHTHEHTHDHHECHAGCEHNQADASKFAAELFANQNALAEQELAQQYILQEIRQQEDSARTKLESHDHSAGTSASGDTLSHNHEPSFSELQGTVEQASVKASVLAAGLASRLSPNNGEVSGLAAEGADTPLRAVDAMTEQFEATTSYTIHTEQGLMESAFGLDEASAQEEDSFTDLVEGFYAGSGLDGEAATETMFNEGNATTIEPTPEKSEMGELLWDANILTPTFIDEILSINFEGTTTANHELDEERGGQVSAEVSTELGAPNAAEVSAFGQEKTPIANLIDNESITNANEAVQAIKEIFDVHVASLAEVNPGTLRSEALTELVAKLESLQQGTSAEKEVLLESIKLTIAALEQAGIEDAEKLIKYYLAEYGHNFVSQLFHALAHIERRIYIEQTPSSQSHSVQPLDGKLVEKIGRALLSLIRSRHYGSSLSYSPAAS